MAPPHADAVAKASAPVTDTNNQMQQSIWRRLFSGWGEDNGIDDLAGPAHKEQEGFEQQDEAKPGLMRRVSRKVVTGLPRTQTFKRQCSEVRSRLEPVEPTPTERRAVSMDRRIQPSTGSAFDHADPRASAPDFLHQSFSAPSSPPSFAFNPLDGMLGGMGDSEDDFGLDRDTVDDDGPAYDADALSKIDVQSMTTSQYGALIDSELERKWILNLSMHFRDKTKREKFFVTYRQHEHHWRRVTISLDYRTAPEDSLEADLAGMQYQREKSAKIYEAIRDSLTEIEFYNTVTNLKLETKEGRLHVHVVEDVNEIIVYPPVRMVQHMTCRRVKEREIHFDSHISGFVYKVRVHGRLLVKKEIPGPETVDEFLYEINALNQLHPAKNVIQFYGIVVDDREETVTGLLIDYAARGALIDVIFDSEHSLAWSTREKWARQIVGGLSEIHEAGFVQGDFTLSNIVIDENDDAKIIDINRRGCPIGWEPPEATPLVDSNQRISMYIGVKSDLYQLGMVLWALATQEDEPEAFGRPLTIDPEIHVPAWYRRIVDTCLSSNPRDRVQAVQLLSWFQDTEKDNLRARYTGPSMSLNGDGHSVRDHLSPSGIPQIRTVQPPGSWAYVGWDNHHLPDDSFYYPSRGRSPPSPMPSNQGDYDSSRFGRRMYTWSDTYNHVPTVPSVSDVLSRAPTEGPVTHLKADGDGLGTYADEYLRLRATATGTHKDEGTLAERGPSARPWDAQHTGETKQTYRAEVAGEDPIAATTWGPPPEHWRFKGQQNGDLHLDDDRHSREPEIRGATGPESQADSGKDVTEVASTPSEPRRYLADGARQTEMRKEPSGGSIESSQRQSSQLRTAMPTTTTTTTTNGAAPTTAEPTVAHHDIDGHDYTAAHEDHGPHDQAYTHAPATHDNATTQNPSLTSDSNVQPTVTTAPPPVFRQPHDDLKGIGCALESTTFHDNHIDEKRLHDLVLDEDDPLDLGPLHHQGPAEALAPAPGPGAEAGVAGELVHD